MISPVKEVAIAILYRENKFLLQLRDNIPTIIHPGCWALFGGHLETGETPESALIREIQEEIDYQITDFHKFICHQEGNIIRHVYYAPLKVEIKQLTLKEGWDFTLAPPETILQGQCYSKIAKQMRFFRPFSPTNIIRLLSNPFSTYQGLGCWAIGEKQLMSNES